MPKRKASSLLPTASSPSSAEWTARQRHEKIPRLGSKILTIIVGQGRKARTFSIHESLASKFSDFFAAAVRKGWKESTERVVKLPEADPESFEIFEAFLYSGRIFVQKDGDKDDTDGKYTTDEEYDRISTAWLLGERLEASDFQDAVVDTLIEKVCAEAEVPFEMYQVIYSGSAGPSSMKDLCVDTALWRWDVGDIVSASLDGAGNEFFADLAIKQHHFLAYGGRPKTAPFEKGPSCIYHEHGEDEHCYKAMFNLN